jgi:penicillin-insensitive murein endopeptidase
MLVRTLAAALVLAGAAIAIWLATPGPSERSQAAPPSLPSSPPTAAAPSKPEAPPPPAAYAPDPADSAPAAPRIRWRRSRALGLPWAGGLRGGVRLPSEGPHFFTWDPVLRRAPNRPWRRFGTARVVRTVLAVLEDFAAAHPDAPRVGVGDLSRSRGGDFGPRFGLPGHASHQNGLDVDLYYPRRDRLEHAPRTAAQIDRRLSQDLVDRFVRAGARYVFVGPNTGLRGPRGVVQALPKHDNHLHVRLPAD